LVFLWYRNFKGTYIKNTRKSDFHNHSTLFRSILPIAYTQTEYIPVYGSRPLKRNHYIWDVP
jgi:hypothetical protein